MLIFIKLAGAPPTGAPGDTAGNLCAHKDTRSERKTVKNTDQRRSLWQ